DRFRADSGERSIPTGAEPPANPAAIRPGAANPIVRPQLHTDPGNGGRIGPAVQPGRQPGTAGAAAAISLAAAVAAAGPGRGWLLSLSIPPGRAKRQAGLCQAGTDRHAPGIAATPL